MLNAQVAKYYVGAPPIGCLACIKSAGSAPVADDPARFKHGIHVHWPTLFVTHDRALQIRESMIAGLTAVGDWSDLVGDAAVPWREVVDKAVYTGGLRMKGARKAKICAACKASGADCVACRRAGYLIDPASATTSSRSRSSGRTSTRRCMVSLRANRVRLLRATTVRAQEGVVATPGYKVYAGAPALAGGARQARSRGAGR